MTGSRLATGGHPARMGAVAESGRRASSGPVLAPYCAGDAYHRLIGDTSPTTCWKAPHLASDCVGATQQIHLGGAVPIRVVRATKSLAKPLADNVLTGNDIAMIPCWHEALELLRRSARKTLRTFHHGAGSWPIEYFARRLRNHLSWHRL